MPIDPRQKALWLYELRLNGFVILRNFLPVDLVASMRTQFEPILLGETMRVREGDAAMLRGNERLSFDLVPYIDRLKGPLDHDLYRRNPVIEELVTEVLKTVRTATRGKVVRITARLTGEALDGALKKDE